MKKPNLIAALSILSVSLTVCGKGDSPRQHLKAFEENGKWGYKNVSGTIVIKPQYVAAYDFKGKLGSVLLSEGWRFIDRRGNVQEIRPFLYDNGPDYHQEGLARFLLDEKIGFIDESSRVAIPARFDIVAPFSEGLAAFCEGGRKVETEEHSAVEGGKWGYSDRRGRVVIPARYEEASQFLGGRATVKLDGNRIVIDKAGRPVKRPSFR